MPIRISINPNFLLKTFTQTTNLDLQTLLVISHPLKTRPISGKQTQVCEQEVQQSVAAEELSTALYWMEKEEGNV